MEMAVRGFICAYRKCFKSFLQVKPIRRTAAKLTIEILQQSKHLSRQLHEFQLASMDLRAAESRRKLSEIHLEKAKNGTLGIDYSEETAESKT